VRDRTNVNIVTLGASQHGKTLLCSRLTEVLSAHGVPVKKVSDIDHMAAEKESGVSQSASHLQFWGQDSKLIFSMADLPGSIQYVKNCLAFLPHADLALLVVHADKGVEEFTRILHYFARHLQVPNIIPVVNQPQADPETLELVLMELEELEGLEEVCLVENLKDQDQGLLALLETAERTIGEEPVREEGQFYMALEQVGNIPSRGTFCAGRVLRGQLKVGDQVEAFYQGSSAKGSVKDLEIYRKGTKDLQAGDRGGAFIKLKPEVELRRGGFLYDPKSKHTVSDSWKVTLECLPGAGRVLARGEAVVFTSALFDGKVIVANVEVLEGELAATTIKLSHKVIGEEGQRFILRSQKYFLLGKLVSPC